MSLRIEVENRIPAETVKVAKACCGKKNQLVIGQTVPHVLASIRTPGALWARLELGRETLRHALNQLAIVAPTG